MPTITLYSTYYGLTQNIPSWDDTCPYQPLRGVECRERAFVASTGLQRVSMADGGGDFDPDFEKWKKAPFEVFKGDGFEIISRRYA